MAVEALILNQPRLNTDLGAGGGQKGWRWRVAETPSSATRTPRWASSTSQPLPSADCAPTPITTTGQSLSLTHTHTHKRKDKTRKAAVRSASSTAPGGIVSVVWMLASSSWHQWRQGRDKAGRGKENTEGWVMMRRRGFSPHCGTGSMSAGGAAQETPPSMRDQTWLVASSIHGLLRLCAALPSDSPAPVVKYGEIRGWRDFRWNTFRGKAFKGPANYYFFFYSFLSFFKLMHKFSQDSRAVSLNANYVFLCFKC